MQVPTMQSSIYILASLFLLPAACSYGSPVRLPPYLDPNLQNTDSSWLAPPLEFYAGTWYLTNASSPDFRRLPNLQWDLWLAVPSCVENRTDVCAPDTVRGQMLDITTWVLNQQANSTAAHDFGARGGGDRPCASFVGHHTPRRMNNPELGLEWDGVFDVAGLDGVMAGYRNQWAVLSWGLDAVGVPFMVVHEAASTMNGETDRLPLMDVITRSPTGVHAGSLAGTLDALIELGNKELTDMVNELGPVEWDYELQGGPAICPQGCLENRSL
jgi:hypothetical protein